MWRYFYIRAQFASGSITESEAFYAPDLDVAFQCARIQWPTAITWECL
jgi:hypothetical protein